MRKGRFRGGPLDGTSHEVPEHFPAYVRFHQDGVVHWYSIKPKTKSTYLYLGSYDLH